MKKITFIIVLLALSFILLLAKDKKKEVAFPKDSTGKIVYTEVVEMPGVTKDVLYSRAYEWFAKSFVSANNVIQMQDKEAGKIIGKGCYGFDKNKVNFTLSIYLKDGKYKYEITDFVHETIMPRGYRGHDRNGGALGNEIPECGKWYLNLSLWNKIKWQTKERILSTIESLKKAMLVESAGNDW